MSYLFVKWIHVLSSTLLFGTGIGSAFYMFMANRRREIPGICFATRHVVIADWLFTAPSAVIQLVTGMILVHLGGYSFRETWVLMGFVLYCVAGGCWLPVLWMQIKMRDMARAAQESGAELPALYWRYERWWVALGTIAFSALIAVFWLMVIKPGLG